MASSKNPVIVWFRNDLRIADNPALVAACKLGQPVIPIYIWNTDEEGNWPMGAASRWWLHYSLQELTASLKSLGMDFLIFSGPSKDVLEKLVKATSSDTIYWNRKYDPWSVPRDTEVKKYFQDKKIEVKSFNSSLLFEPFEISTQQGKPYQVFTPFWKNCLEQASARGPLDTPKYKASLSKPLGSLVESLETYKLDQLELLPKINWDGGFKEMWQPGEAGGKERFQAFSKKTIRNYKVSRDYPSNQGVSYISPHLHFGEISPHQIWSHVEAKYRNHDHKAEKESINTYLKEIGWREFAHHVLYHFPETANEPLRDQFKSFKWASDKKGLTAWQKGLTGYPIVDAGMRELWHTGWMHNRVRMIVASFLTKDLLISWKEGAIWFWDTLVDADFGKQYSWLAMGRWLWCRCCTIF